MTTEPLVLAVDDELGILKLMRLELSAQGFRVITANGAKEASKLAEEQRPEVILLDILMPEVNGLELMKELRDRSDTPIILVTGKTSEKDKVSGLELGADDYIVKPFSLDELGARIRAVLRRSTGVQPAHRMFTAGDIEIDLEKRLVKKRGEAVALTRNEWLLLQSLAMNAGKVMLNAELLTKVWGSEYRDDTQYLRVWVSRLRHKLEDDPANATLIRTLPGIGYMMVDHEGSETAPKADEVATT